MKIGVIISTYNNPHWLEKTLWGYLSQSRMADEIVIADDGSGSETARLIDSYATQLPLSHVWHPDNGFQKTAILNKALRAATADYLIFTDQDCIPRADFIATHEYFAEKGYFLSGGYFKLPMHISELISRDDVSCGRAFQLKWLRENGLKTTFKCTKLIRNRFFSNFMNAITPANASWNGMNSSGWRADILAANGFDERMKYGGEDRELGERLFNAGIRSKQIRYRAIALHLDHSRPYVNEEALNINRQIRNITKKEHLTQTPFGIRQIAP